MRKRATSELKVKTSVNLSQTKPIASSFWGRLKKRIFPDQQPKLLEESTKPRLTTRIQPQSKIAQAEKLSLWFIPARLGYLLNGLYYILFAVVGLLGILGENQIIQPFFTLPFDNSFSSYYLLETTAAFALVASMLFLHAACRPRVYKWFYFFLILIFLPYHFLSNLQKMQIELPLNFQNYLYFDTIAVSVFWGILILSIYPYIKSLRKS